MDNAFFGLIPNLGWATGDINFDGVINFDDYSKVDQAFFFQAIPLSREGASVVPEPAAWLTAVLVLLALAMFARHFAVGQSGLINTCSRRAIRPFVRHIAPPRRADRRRRGGGRNRQSIPTPRVPS